MSQEKHADLVGSSKVNLALINGLSFSNCSSIADLKIDISFVGTGALRAEILIWKAKNCVHL